MPSLSRIRHREDNEDFYRRSLSTLISGVVMLLLSLIAKSLPRLVHGDSWKHTELTVDTSRGEKLQIYLNVTFPSLACSIISLDAMDISGEQHLDLKHNIFKKNLVVEPPKQESLGAPERHAGGLLEHNKAYCGSCFGAAQSDDDCCNSCEEVREAYRRKGWGSSNPGLIDQCKREGWLEKIKEDEGEGCNVYGTLEVNKVAGNFHFAPGKSFQQSNTHVDDLLAFQKESFNVSHKINELSFGPHFPGVICPLDKAERIQGVSSAMYQYIIKVGLTVYKDIHGHKIQTNQFSVTEHFRTVYAGRQFPPGGVFGGRFLPGVFFFYHFSHEDAQEV